MDVKQVQWKKTQLESSKWNSCTFFLYLHLERTDTQVLHPSRV